jgi:hypothetical protein
VRFRVGEAARVSVVVRRGGKRVRRFAPRTYQPGAAVRLRVPARVTRRGLHRVVIRADRGPRRATVRLAARRL